MIKTIMRSISVLTGIVFFCASAYAQITNSSLSGQIADANGKPVPGAVVIAVHEPSGTQYHAVSNDEGRYNINGMRTGGPYKVEVTCLGYRDVIFKDVDIALAESVNINASLQDETQTLAEAVVISQATSKFAAENTGAATNISNREILETPMVNRSISEVTRLSPYGGDGMSFAGTDGRTANFTVDGANFNNNFGLSSNLPGGGNPISIDAIEEMQVVISPYDVRQTNFIGGGVNAITKSGTNTFKGSAYVYHKNEFMRGDTVYGEQISGARDKDRKTTYGFTLGGPIVKNKLFFFVNFEMDQVPTVVNRWRASEDGVADPDNYISRTSVEDMQKVQDYVKNKYGYDTGSYTSFPANEQNIKVLGRIDWNINDNNRLAVRYNYTLNDAWTAPNGTSMDGGTRMSSYRTSQNSMAFANSLYSTQNVVHTVSVDLNSKITADLSNQFLATYSMLNDVRGSNSSEFPFVDITKEVDGVRDNYMSLGYELFTWNNAVHNNVLNIKDDIVYYLGTHKITAGLTYEYQMADNMYMRNGTGYYRYNSVDDFLNEAAPEVVCLTYGYNGESNPAARVQFHRPGIYAQDEWNATDSFKLTYGLRIDGLFFDNNDLMTNNAIKDIAYYPASKGGAETHIDTGRWPNASVTFSPRVGFNWNILGDHSLKLRGGTGLFTGRLPLVFFTNMPTNSGMVQYAAQINNTNLAKLGAVDADGNTLTMDYFKGGMNTTIASLQEKIWGIKDKNGNQIYPSSITPEEGTAPSSISAVDPDFKMPQVWKTSLALDYAFPTSFPFSVSAEGIFNKTINAACIKDWSMKDPTYFAKFNGVDNRPIYPSDFRSTTSAFVLENTSEGYGWSASAAMKMSPIKGLDIMAAYTYTANKEITGLPGSNAESAMYYVPTTEGPNNIKLHNSQYVTPHRIIASVTHRDKCGNHFSLIYEAYNGGYNYSYMTSNDMNGDSYNYDLIYIPTDEQVANGDFRFTSQDDADRFMAYVHNDEYLSKHQGQYAEPYSVYSPWLHRFDFSYKHDFVIKHGGSKSTIQLCFDIKNLANLFCSSWGVAKYLNPEIGTEARILKYEGTDSEGYATFSTPSAINGSTQTFVPYHAVGQCWNASIGIKYMFN